MKPRDKRAMPDFAALLEYPLRLPGWGAETVKWLDDAMASDMRVSRALAAAAVRRGGAIDACPDPAIFVVDPTDDAPLATAVAASGAEGEIDRADVAARVAGVPMDLQGALAPIVRAIAVARAEVVAARAGADTKLLKTRAADFVMGTGSLGLDAAAVAKIDAFDVARVVRAATLVATAVESAKLARFAGAAVPSVDLDTPVGPIVLRGPGADTYEGGAIASRAALVLDTGGDDVYRAPVAARTIDRPVSIAVDLGGRDAWSYDEKPDADDAKGKRLPSDGAGRLVDGRTASRVGRQGSGWLGVGLLWDLGGGADTYRSLTISQGAGVFGVGVLFDDGGDDTYSAEALAQGAAGWGVGLLLDRAGNDKHVVYTSSQGFGFTKGLGALVDMDGDDVYDSDVGDPELGGDPLYANAQRPGKANTSMSQGCGRGNRPDVPEPGFPMAGGIGILRDAKGDDRYLTSIFGQGCAFAMGIGLFADGAGNDTYEGIWYVQGANAHTGLSLFVDGAGDDRYDPTFPITATSIGVGHDFSAAIHHDMGGDDTYRAPGLSLGAGNANGFGLFVNAGGADTFDAKGPITLGAANATEILPVVARQSMPTVGVFVKAGGRATYAGASLPDAGADLTWGTTPNADAGVAERAVGVDRPGGKVVLP
jgi:hypothetical protein